SGGGRLGGGGAGSGARRLCAHAGEDPRRHDEQQHQGNAQHLLLGPLGGQGGQGDGVERDLARERLFAGASALGALARLRAVGALVRRGRRPRRPKGTREAIARGRVQRRRRRARGGRLGARFTLRILVLTVLLL